MQLTHANDNSRHAALHAKIRAKAIDVNGHSSAFDGVDEFCRRINRLRRKSDRELSRMGLERSEIGAHVLNRLLN